MNKLYKTWAEIDCAAIRNNIGAMRARAGEGVALCAVVKSDAYGHGMVEVSRSALSAGAVWLGVSNIYEGLKLRRTFPDVRILILSAGMAGHATALVRNRLTPVICSSEMLEAVAAAAVKENRVMPIHVIIDTGMGRIGLWHSRAFEFLQRAARTRGILLEGTCSHFACAGEGNQEFTRLQLTRFKRVLHRCEREGIDVPVRHIANSGAILNTPPAGMTLARIGITMYGVYPAVETKRSVLLTPALTLKTQVCFLKRVPPGRSISYCRSYVTYRDTMIATIPVGYGDGYSRRLSNRGSVLIRGRRAPLAGNVTMDQSMVDVGHIPGVRVGDEVVLIGSQGESEITVNEIADLVDTIPYDVLCALGKQVQHRKYLNRCT